MTDPFCPCHFIAINYVSCCGLSVRLFGHATLILLGAHLASPDEPATTFWGQKMRIWICQTVFWRKRYPRIEIFVRRSTVMGCNSSNVLALPQNLWVKKSESRFSEALQGKKNILFRQLGYPS